MRDERWEMGCVRTFVSIEIPEDIKDNIEKSIGEMKVALQPIKWVDKKNQHITLKFLGWVEDRKIDDLTGSLTDLAKDFGTIKVSFAGLGVFPDAKRPRVVWVGIDEGGDRVKKLAERLEDRLSKEGYREGEDREFSPHLTIGRIKEKIDAEALSSYIEKNKKADFGGFVVKNISLMKSTLRRSGPIYEEIKKIKI
jgi:2'-5' RNA ligase